MNRHLKWHSWQKCYADIKSLTRHAQTRDLNSKPTLGWNVCSVRSNLWVKMFKDCDAALWIASPHHVALRLHWFVCLEVFAPLRTRFAPNALWSPDSIPWHRSFRSSHEIVWSNSFLLGFQRESVNGTTHGLVCQYDVSSYTSGHNDVTPSHILSHLVVFFALIEVPSLPVSWPLRHHPQISTLSIDDTEGDWSCNTDASFFSMHAQRNDSSFWLSFQKSSHGHKYPLAMSFCVGYQRQYPMCSAAPGPSRLCGSDPFRILFIWIGTSSR